MRRKPAPTSSGIASPVLQALLIAAGVSALALCVWGLSVRSQFRAALDTMETAVRAPRAKPETRDDLPPEVRALAYRLGAVNGTASFVTFSQIGRMWRAPGAKPMVFHARQTNALSVSDYIWRADFEPFSAFTAVDYSVAGRAGLEVRIGGVIPVVREIGTPAILRGERMRYLAELPLMPDAIMANRSLDWRVLNEHTLVVGQGVGAERAEVTLHLGPEGFVESMEAASRPAQVGKTLVDRPWGGRFQDYKMYDRRMIPGQAEVYWVIGGKQFVYWQGRVTGWTIDAGADAPAAAKGHNGWRH